MIPWLRYRVRWWRWFLNAPSLVNHVRDGGTPETWEDLMRLWDAKEPKA